MINILKRYGMAMVFLFLVIFLMLMGTLAVESFGNKMFEDVNVDIKPRGEEIKI
jgi:Na+-transporting methylmalonyl-CoA/oxaloacetate decarboxylase gamma subunit